MKINLYVHPSDATTRLERLGRLGAWGSGSRQHKGTVTVISCSPLGASHLWKLPSGLPQVTDTSASGSQKWGLDKMGSWALLWNSCLGPDTVPTE